MPKPDITLIHGDCLLEMPKLPEKSIDCIITDLPYGVTGCEWDSLIPFDSMWECIKRVIKPRGVVVFFGTEPFASNLRLSNLPWYKYDWVWEKNNAGNFQLVNYQPLKIHETISVFCEDSPNMVFADIMIEHMQRLNLKQKDLAGLCLSKTGGITGWVSNKLKGLDVPTREQWERLCELFGIENEYDELLLRGRNMTYNMVLEDVNIVMSNKGKGGNLQHLGSESKRENYVQEKSGYPKSILRYKRETGLHPTQKPVPLLEFLVKTYTNEGETVLDFCSGVGSTGVACIDNKRNFIGIEKEEKYWNMAGDRIKYLIRNRFDTVGITGVSRLNREDDWLCNLTLIRGRL